MTEGKVGLIYIFSFLLSFFFRYGNMYISLPYPFWEKAGFTLSQTRTTLIRYFVNKGQRKIKNSHAVSSQAQSGIYPVRTRYASFLGLTSFISSCCVFKPAVLRTAAGIANGLWCFDLLDIQRVVVTGWLANYEELSILSVSSKPILSIFVQLT